ncbi:alpha-keto acid decarboxylase family protein [Celerinatantimonas sp. YJH-8]|uniref:alpha-keto acid decarboxylase family protein n=1 Tax=Celerinatantimonas sp. YJH-8 TaxID=3228714 RepID=UPI0038C11BC3
MQTTIGNYLWERLKQLGVRYVFGVPGDFNLQLLEQLHDIDGIEFVGNCNELNASYAADGYARLNGIAAIITTYGVGDLSALCGIAGSCAEHLPVVMITGVPPLYVMRNRLRVHHSMAEGNFDNIMNCAREFTSSGARITPSNAAIEIDRALTTCWQERCPVYLQIPSNISYLNINAPTLPLTRTFAPSDSLQLSEARKLIQEQLHQAKQPLILVDMDADRSQIHTELQTLADHCQIPYASFRSGKAILDESSPLWLGHYPNAPESAVSQWLANADCIIATAPCYSEGSSMVATDEFPIEKTIYLRGEDVTIAGETYEGVSAQQLMAELIRELPTAHNKRPPLPRKAAPLPLTHQVNEALTHAKLWPHITSYFQAKDVIIGEMGCSHIGLLDQPLPHGCHYIAQSIWGAIGFSLPALLGTMMAAPERRHWLFIGDGSLQMTVQELSTILNRGLKPTIILLNNQGYTIERFILGENAAYNDIASWDHQSLIQAFAPKASIFYRRVATHGALDQALTQRPDDQACIIELTLDPMDAPQLLHTFGPKTADFDYGPRGPQRRQH